MVHHLTKEGEVTLELAGATGAKASEVVNQMGLIIVPALEGKRGQTGGIVRLE